MRRIDAHQHYWSLAHRDYGWLTPALGAIHRDFGPPELHPLLDAAGIEATVLVQAAPTEAETARLIALARQPGSRVAGVVGWCDLLAADAPARVARLAAEPLLVGLRPMLQDIDDPRWILQPALRPAIEAMVEHGLAFDALVLPHQLGPLAEFIARHPRLRVVVDHAAKPAIATRGLGPWAREIGQIAQHTAASCKLSGLVTEAGPGWLLDDLRPCVAHLLASFGPARLIWGSDWPVLNLAADYPRWLQASEALLAPLGAAERAQVFGGNAAAFYRLPAAGRGS
jgi:L-fuconolactonase